MKLTPELIAASESRLNPIKDRELDLRGLKIPAIENLGVTRDQNDTLDLTDNDIRSLSNFPHLPRLSTLVVSNNVVSRIDARLAHSLPRLRNLVLTNNQMAEMAALEPLGRLPCLEFLSLLGNPVTRRNNYREYVVWRCKNLRVLDFKRIRNRERELAKRLMETPEGRPSALAASISQSASRLRSSEAQDGEGGGGVKTFEVGSATGTANGRGGGGGKDALPRGAAGRLMTPQERRALEEAIEKSSSLDEIRRLEDRLRLGYTVET